MSASQEILAESLRTLDAQIAEREHAGEDTTSLKKERKTLLRQLARVNAALNENTNILKG